MITNYYYYFSKYRSFYYIELHCMTVSLFESSPCPGHKIKIGAAIILLRSLQLLNIFDFTSLKNVYDNILI